MAEKPTYEVVEANVVKITEFPEPIVRIVDADSLLKQKAVLQREINGLSQQLSKNTLTVNNAIAAKQRTIDTIDSHLGEIKALGLEPSQDAILQASAIPLAE